MRKEVVDERALIRFVRKHGGLAVKLRSPGRGFPDRTIILPGGKILFIELKRKDGKVSPHQQRWLKRLRDRGHEAYVTWSYEEAIERVRDALGTSQVPSRTD